MQEKLNKATRMMNYWHNRGTWHVWNGNWHKAARIFNRLITLNQWAARVEQELMEAR